MHAGHRGRRQQHREAQHHLRAPRHPRAGRRGRPLPPQQSARGARIAALRVAACLGQARPLECQAVDVARRRQGRAIESRACAQRAAWIRTVGPSCVCVWRGQGPPNTPRAE
jgi:hypothetical protein